MRKLLMLGAVVLAGAGCGGGADAPPSDRAVIERWSQAVRKADYETANAQFAVPATIDNGPPLGETQLTSAEQVNGFNRGFPCGAKLEATQDEPGGSTLATFELVEASGGRTCPGAVGAKAKVSFEIDDAGRITGWFRVSTEPPPGSQET